jgi:hypothetical protein
MQRIGGHISVTAEANGRAFYGIWRNGRRENLLITATQILISQDGETYPTDVTPAIMVDAADWLMNQYGDWVILSSLASDPLVLDPNGLQFVPFTNWPANYRAARVAPYQGVLVAVGVEITGIPQGGMVKWSDTVDLSNLEDVEWDYTVLTNIAGENVLPTEGDVIEEFGVLRDAGILYNTTSVWRMDPSAARPQGVAEVFRFRQVFADDGIISQRCWAEVEGYHYVVGSHNIYRHDGHQQQPISDNRVTEYFFETLGSEGFVFMADHVETHELLIVFSRRDQVYASEGIVYNYIYDAWTGLSIADADGGANGYVTHIDRGAAAGAVAPTYATIVGTYADFSNTSYADLFPKPGALELYGLARGTGTIDRLNQSPDVSDFTPTMLLERIDMDLDEFFQTARSLKYWSRTHPLMSGTGSVRFQFGGRNELAGPVQWGPEQTYVIGTDYKIDHRVTYRYPAMRMLQDDDGIAEMTGADLDVRVGPRR